MKKLLLVGMITMGFTHQASAMMGESGAYHMENAKDDKKVMKIWCNNFKKKMQSDTYSLWLWDQEYKRTKELLKDLNEENIFPKFCMHEKLYGPIQQSRE